MVKKDVRPEVQSPQIAAATSDAQSPSSPIPVSSIAALKVAINTHVRNKIAREDFVGWSHATYKFVNRELAPDEFIESVASGFAFCAWLKGQRKSTNFVCMQVLAVDIDSGLTIEDVLAHPFFQNFGWFIYTTPSHRADAHRFRIVFLMERPIETEQRMNLAYTGIIRMFAGDRSCTDASRLFYGSENCEVHRVDRVLPMEQVEYVIELGENRIHNDGRPIRDADPSNSRSSVVLDRAELVKTESDGTYPLHELEARTRVFCPRHVDRHASAFVVTSRVGQNGVYCSTCAQTFWPMWNRRSHLHEYDFYSLEHELIEIDYEEGRQHPSEWLDDEAPAEYREMIDEKSVFTRDSRYLDEAGFPDLGEGVNCVRSPKGTGKTQWLERAVQQYKAEGKSVLLIVHRQALAESLADRLKMHCYLRKLEHFEDRTEILRYCVVCLDSLGHYLNAGRNNYDVVLIDESEQVFSHVLSSTLAGKRKPCFEKLHLYIRRAKQVVLCDADLGWLTFNVTALLREDKGAVRFYVNRFRKNQDPGQRRHVVHLYNSDTQLTDYTISVVGSGGKQFIACNSKDRAKTLKKLLNQRYGDKVRIRIITSDNSTTDEGRKFIARIKETSDTYDVLIVSPSVGTGVDINIPDELPQFTHVIGFFEAAITTHFEMDQQLARVRNMYEQHVWISSARLYLEYEVEAVRQSILSRGELPEVLKGFDWYGRPEYHENDKLIEVYAQVKSMRHASLNNVREHFIDLKKREGWEVREAGHELVLDSKKLQKEYHGAKKQVIDEDFVRIAAASSISRNRYRELRDKQTVTLYEKAQISRYQIEDFYGVKEVSVELARLDDHGKYRNQVRFYSLFVGTRRQLDAYALSEQSKSVVERADYGRKCKLLRTLLRAAGVVDEDGKLDTFSEFESITLGAFVEAVELRSREIGLVLGARIRDDLRKKPIMQLSVFLNLIGLKTTSRNKYEGQKKLYKYRLDLDCIEQLERYRKKFAKGLDSVRVHANPVTGDHMMLVTDAADMRKWAKSPAIIELQPIDPNPFDRDEGLIPLATAVG